MPKSRFSAFLYLLLVFLSGALVGAFAHRLYMVNTVISGFGGNGAGPRRGPDPEEVRKQIVTEMRNKVKLDDQQVKQFNLILDGTREQFGKMHERMNAEGRGIRDNQVEKVNAILRDDQRPLYDKLRAEHEAERKRRKQLQGDKK